jgi:hypothetical protein
MPMTTPTLLLLMPDGLVVASLLVAEVEDDWWAGTLHPWNLPPELRAGIPWYAAAANSPTSRSVAVADAAVERLNLRAYSQRTKKLYAIRSLQLRDQRVRLRLHGPGTDPDREVAAWSITEGGPDEG